MRISETTWQAQVMNTCAKAVQYWENQENETSEREEKAWVLDWTECHFERILLEFILWHQKLASTIPKSRLFSKNHKAMCMGHKKENLEFCKVRIRKKRLLVRKIRRLTKKRDLTRSYPWYLKIEDTTKKSDVDFFRIFFKVICSALSLLPSWQDELSHRLQL